MLVHNCIKKTLYFIDFNKDFSCYQRQLLLLALVTCWAAGCANHADWLNSERINRTFGSYGVDVLRTENRRRVSSLFSLNGDTKITRTYAVVDFVDTANDALLPMHRAIMAGGSIGATFQDAGWQLDKQHLYIGELDLPATYSEIASLMRIALPKPIAAHVYLLNVRKDGHTIQYATITELHHPDYLTPADLIQIYGEILFDDSNRDSVHDFIGPPVAPAKEPANRTAE